MDIKTLTFYSANAVEIAQRYEASNSSLSAHFASAFSPTGRILDIGCGSGRDMAELMHQGFEAYGLDGTPEFVELAQTYHPELKGRVEQGTLPDFMPPFGGEFDGVLCSAVLMHIDSTELLNAALAIKRCLKVNGRLLISIPSQRSDVNPDERDDQGRLFKSYPPGYLQLIFERLGFSLINQWSNADAMQRKGIEWVSLLFQLKAGANTRPIDQIVGVLNNDAKSATYKFALFRALSDIAIKSPDIVTWLGNEQVGLPVRLVADKWLEYYWPLLTANVFIPQLNGEKVQTTKSIKFRKSLQALALEYEHSGGYSGFKVERNKGLLSPHKKVLLSSLMKDITDAIVKGPVVYAGGAVSSGRVFSFDSKIRHIVMPKDLWLELSQLGYWISQAVILQWAEKTAKLGDGIDVSTVIGLLLDKEDERSTIMARSFFKELKNIECVWTGVKLQDRFDIDHLIPFDLWHNNDAWNLLPASKKANSQKSNKLPSPQILRTRKDCIIGYWELLRDNDSNCFDREAETLLTLPKQNWQNMLYGQMCNAIEVTALQRGAVRWPTA